jgi:hypothetical protein
MKKTNSLVSMLAAAIACMALTPVAQAQKLPDADASEVAAYTLTEAAFAKYVAATHNLRGIKIEDCDDDTGPKNITQTAARIDAVPGAKAAVQSAGLTSREYVVFTFSLMQNGIASHLMDRPGAKLPAGTNPANVEFFRKHSAAMEQFANERDEGGCDESGK